MKHILSFSLCFILIQGLTSIFLFAADHVETIQLSTGSLLPYTGENIPHNGTAARIVTEAFAAEGIKVEYVFLPWKRAFMEAKEGSLDGSILWRETPERKKHFYFSDSVLKVDIVFFHLKRNEFKWSTIDDLKKSKVRVGYIQGLKYEDEFDIGINSGEIAGDKVTSLEQNLRKLLLGRVSITPTIKESGYETIKGNFSPEKADLFTHHTSPLATHSLHLIMPKINNESARLMKLFNKGLNKLHSNENY